MFLMSTSIVLCENFTLFNTSKRLHLYNISSTNPSSLISSSMVSSSLIGRRTKRNCMFITKAKNDEKWGSKKKRPWWKKFFLDEDANWLGLEEKDLLEEEVELEFPTGDEKLSEEEKFEAWKRRAEAITELREAQEDMKNVENRMWEDWLVEDGPDSQVYGGDWSDIIENSVNEVRADPSEMMPERGLVKTVKDLVFGMEEDDLLYEDRVFQYASSNSAKFLAVLVLIPWALDFVVHDFVLMPFLDRYVKTVPLAAEFFDVRRPQKLQMVKELKIERSSYRLEAEIGKSPPLADDEVWLQLRPKALELRDEWRLENRRAFANIWSDMVFGVALFMLLYFNQSKVALLKFTGYKLINNISDTGKAFLIILITDIFLGYHSESGWQTLLEVLVDHYGLEVDQSAIVLFVCLVPVVIDACVKLWLFKFLPRLSPKVSNIFREMTRH
ncbi:chloroplast envelope membrane protein-like isoform X1 [Papaver somniferum]|uniref:chloroplast envelope membrane protein-like isoform X1 n=1 Tax=Papaver somniferum TaxID=3469 RepID=UPI000E6F9864|nr:chloroplast envelope membrane protein-like isoform X1 [Papaver somniferum]